MAYYFFLLLMLFCNMLCAMEIKIIGVRTTDNAQFMVLQQFVDESRILRNGIYTDGASVEPVTNVAMTLRAFKELLPLLKMGAEITRLQQEVDALADSDECAQKKVDLAAACRNLRLAVVKGTKRDWHKWLKISKELDILTLHNAAVATGRTKGWIKQRRISQAGHKKK